MARSSRQAGADALSEIARFARSFSGALQKIKEGAETEGSDIRLTSQECKDLIHGIRAATRRPDEK